MQVTAILQAACQCRRASLRVRPRIMIPLVMDAGELRLLRRLTQETAEAVFRQDGDGGGYEFGAMIETPRAALLAGEIAEVCGFF